MSKKNNYKTEQLAFQCQDKLYTVFLTKNAYNEVLRQCSISKERETGGILIGQYANNNSVAIIDEAVPPPKKSFFSKNSFIRAKDGLLNLLDNRWKNGMYYLGEWHYHPFASSIPSCQDIKQMKTMSKNQSLKCPEPILLIIGGSPKQWDLHLSIFIKDKHIHLHKTIITDLK